jgi:hypothetical protein
MKGRKDAKTLRKRLCLSVLMALEGVEKRVRLATKARRH